MPTFQYEAMDHTGKEVKDSIDASTQEEAQQLIRQKGFFVTKIAERAAKAEEEGPQRPRKRKKGQGRKKKKAFTIGKISTKQLCIVHPPALHAPGRRPAGPAQPQDSGEPVQAGRPEERPDRRGRRHRERLRPSRRPSPSTRRRSTACIAT